MALEWNEKALTGNVLALTHLAVSALGSVDDLTDDGLAGRDRQVDPDEAVAAEDLVAAGVGVGDGQQWCAMRRETRSKRNSRAVEATRANANDHFWVASKGAKEVSHRTRSRTTPSRRESAPSGLGSFMRVSRSSRSPPSLVNWAARNC